MSAISTSTAKATQRVLVIDFGAQYAQLIARRVREASVFSELVPHTITASEVAQANPAAIILSGGPASVHVEGAPGLDSAILELGIPILGICYGAQLLAVETGGLVARNESGEYGRTDLKLEPGSGSGLLDPAVEQCRVWMSHFDAIVDVPEGAVVTASSPHAPVAAFEDPEAKMWAVQFHPEVIHTEGGQQIIERFLWDLAGCEKSWDPANIIESSTEAISKVIGDGQAVCGLSGGVDSAVAAALVHGSIGDRLTCIYVDTGLMRMGESEQVIETFSTHQGMELIAVDASERFFQALVGVTDPEKKRKVIGELFIRIFEDEAAKLGQVDFLVQGTLYPDVVESGSDVKGKSATARIKSHHNVGGLPDDLQFQLVEPLRNLFKDEVRQVGTDLGLPPEIVWRQPFPGPGLAVRIIGEVTVERVATLQQADKIVQDEIKRAGLNRELWQAFCVLADIRSVGVMGDERTYGHPIIIRAVTSQDVMTADWARLDYDLLQEMSLRITNEVEGINRVVYDITSKPPGTIEWE